MAEELVALGLEAGGGGELSVRLGGLVGGLGGFVALGLEAGELVIAAAFLSASHCSTGICPGFSGQYRCPRNCVCPEPVNNIML